MRGEDNEGKGLYLKPLHDVLNNIDEVKSLLATVPNYIKQEFCLLRDERGMTALCLAAERNLLNVFNLIITETRAGILPLY